MKRELFMQIILAGYDDGSYKLSVADRHGYNTLTSEAVPEEAARAIAVAADEALRRPHAVRMVNLTNQAREQRLAELRRQRDAIVKKIEELEG